MPIILDPALGTSDGRYWTRAGVINVLGELSLAIYSNLDNDTTEEVASRVAADGSDADDWTDFRARRGSKPRGYDDDHPIPIPEDDEDFSIIRKATNYYAAALLVEHRVARQADGTPAADLAPYFFQRADTYYKALFGDFESHDPSKPKPGTFQSVGMRFEPECDTDEFASY